MTRPSEPQMHEQPNPSDHARHDLMTVAALADREATGEEAERARAQIAACQACADLHADLVSLARATHALPAIQRPRDFRLRPVDAQRLRPNLVRRLLGSFGTARDGFSRPLAMGLTTLGIAGLMLGILPGTLSFGGAASAPAAPEVELAAPAASQPAAGGAPAAASPQAGPLGQEFGQDGTDTTNQRDTSGGPVAIAGESDTFAADAQDATGVAPLVVVSGTLLIVGLALFLLRWTSRRFGG